jgi:hypothetical protein
VRRHHHLQRLAENLFTEKSPIQERAEWS